MTPVTLSTLGLILCLAPAMLHAVEVVRPLWARWIVNYVLPFFSLTLPSPSYALTEDAQLEMLDAARAAGPQGKDTAKQDYLFLMLFEQRQGSLAFISVAIGVIYALGLPLEERALLHFILIPLSALFMLANLNHAGIRFLGHHPRVSRNGRNVGIVFTPFWAVSALLNYLAFGVAGA